MCLRVLALVALAAAAIHGAPAGPDGWAATPEHRVFASPHLVQPSLKWWQTAIVYQIYPASFKDSNGDGTGDIPGITSKLEYLRDVGVGALWLSPIFKSPNKDMGYDISDYKDILPAYGTLEDFDAMVAKAHSLGLKVILDFVPNHSSDEHRWFKEALKGKDNPYHDYYVWNDGINGTDGKKLPPNNWKSVFDQSDFGKAWKYVPALDQFYLRTFHEGQPDLNYNNPKVVREMKDVFRFWARRGVDGFRIDAIPYLFEDPLLRDNSFTEGPNGEIHMGKERTENLQRTYDMVRQWREVFDEEGARLGKDLVMMLEAYASEDETMKYFGTKDQPAGHFPFNFFLISNINNASTASDYVTHIEAWNKKKPVHGWSNWVMGNHDNHRIGSRMGEERIDAINILMLLLPGTAVTYYGEELGMVDNTDLTIADCKDPQACPDGANEEYYKDHSRDYERTPFQWDNTAYAGFSESKPWLPVADNYKELNVQKEKDDENSHLSIYMKLSQLRKSHVIQHGHLEVKDYENVLTFLRQDGQESVLVLINMGNKKATVNVTNLYGQVGDLKVFIASNFVTTDVDLRKVELDAFGAVVLRGDRFKWWQTGIVYQIYPRTFKDSGNDGDGDLKGITSKLDYLKSLRVSAVWLSPIFKSGGIDGGYDIADFRVIEDVFGNLEDFDAMVKRAHELGLRVLLDFVPNHSSDEHMWFQEALKGNETYVDYYVWHPGKTVEGVLQVPNNWGSIFGGPAWTYVEERKMFYLHQFHRKQPDLNYRTLALVNEIKDILRFWINKGVDGFRVDAVQHLFEDENFADNQEWNEKMVHQPETFDMVKQWRQLLEEESKKLNKDLVLMLEVWADADTLHQYYGTVDEPGAHFPFNFFLLQDNYNANGVKGAIDGWKYAAPTSFEWCNWVVGNHDKSRLGTRAGEDLIDAINMLVTMLPGTGVTYNGEEIGMFDYRDLTIADCRDLQACPNKENPTDEDEKRYQEESRDFQRTPFQWDDSSYAGFCDDCTPWLKVHSNKDEINEKLEDAQRNSHLFVYRRLVQLREEEAIQSSPYPEPIVLDEDVLVFTRKNETYAFVVVINFGEEAKIVNLAEIYEDIGTVKVYVASKRFLETTAQIDFSAVRVPGKSSAVLEGTVRQESTQPEALKWWQTGIIYQIYPRSFQDSDNDGIGDLPGITSRLQYLKDLGVAAVWLSPIFKSPDDDMGYDISDFKNINDYYGNLDDFDEMLREAHRLGLKVVLDFVPNHSSDLHEWYQDVLKKGVGSDYYDFYIWRPEKEGSVPNNWISAFDDQNQGSAWSKPSTRDGSAIHKSIRDMYYLHQFHERQPDLNYRNPKLVQEMKDVLRFWVERGVDGFRVDAIQHLVENADFEDNTVGRDKQIDQEETIEMVKQWKDVLDREGSLLQKELVLMLEVYSEDVDNLMRYFGSSSRPAGNFPFNFYMISELGDHPTAVDVEREIKKWLDKDPRWSNWVVGNHDNHRVGSRVGEELIDAFNALVTMLPGTAITYQGEEIGMTNNNALTLADCQDPQACLSEELYKAKTRDYERTPFQWDDSEFAGFSNRKPWLPINQENYETINVKAEEEDPKSHLNVYKKLAALRGEGAIQRGDSKVYTTNGVLVLQRFNATHVYLVAINFGNAERTIDLNTEFDALPPLLHYVSSSNFEVPEEEFVDASKLKLKPYSTVVLTSEPLDDGDDFSEIDNGGNGSGGGGDGGASTIAPLAAMIFIVVSLNFFTLMR